jgi:hypothetical protein
MVKKRAPTQREIIALAAAANVDPRTAKRALVHGVEAIRGEEVRARLRAAMKTYGLERIRTGSERQ